MDFLRQELLTINTTSSENRGRLTRYFDMVDIPDGVTANFGTSYQITFFNSGSTIKTVTFFVSPIVSAVTLSNDNLNRTFSTASYFQIQVSPQSVYILPFKTITYYTDTLLTYFKEDMTLPNGTYTDGEFIEGVFSGAYITSGTVTIQNKILTVSGQLWLYVPTPTRLVVFKNHDNSQIIRKEVTGGRIIIYSSESIPVDKIAFAMFEKDSFKYNTLFSDFTFMMINNQPDDLYYYTTPWDLTENSSKYQYFGKPLTQSQFVASKSIYANDASAYIYAWMPLYRTLSNDNMYSNMRGMIFNNKEEPAIGNQNYLLGYHYNYNQTWKTFKSSELSPRGLLQEQAYFNLPVTPVILGSNLFTSDMGRIRVVGATNDNIQYFQANRSTVIYNTVFDQNNHIYLFYVPPINEYTITYNSIRDGRLKECQSGMMGDNENWYTLELCGCFPDLTYEKGKIYRVPSGTGTWTSGIGTLARPQYEVKEAELDYESLDEDKQYDILAWEYIKHAVKYIDLIYAWELSPEVQRIWMYFDNVTKPSETKRVEVSQYSQGSGEKANNYFSYSKNNYFFGALWTMNVKNYPYLSYGNLNTDRSTYNIISGSVWIGNNPFSFSVNYATGQSTVNYVNGEYASRCKGNNGTNFVPMWVSDNNTIRLSGIWQTYASSYTRTFTPIFYFDACNEIIRAKNVYVEKAYGGNTELLLSASSYVDGSYNNHFLSDGILIPTSGEFGTYQDYISYSLGYYMYHRMRLVGGKGTAEGFYILFYFPKDKDTILPSQLPHNWIKNPVSITPL